MTGTSSSLTTIRITQTDLFGNFGQYSWLACLIILASIVGLYYLGRWAGIRGVHWLWPWLFCLTIGDLALINRRALSGYIVFLGLLGTGFVLAKYSRSKIVLGES